MLACAIVDSAHVQRKNREARIALWTWTILAPLLLIQPTGSRHSSAHSLGAEGAATATRGLRLRIFNREPGPLKTVHVIDFSSLQKRGTLRIHDDLNDTLFHHGVVVAHLRLEGHPVLIPVAAAALDINAQADDILLFHHQFLDLLFRYCSNCQHCDPPRVPKPSSEDLLGMV